MIAFFHALNDSEEGNLSIDFFSLTRDLSQADNMQIEQIHALHIDEK